MVMSASAIVGGAAGGAAMSSGELAKAFITNVETGERIECLFNPSEYTLSKTNSWAPVSIVGSNVPRTEFTGGNPTQLSLELFFDTYEQRQDVRKYTDKIFKLAMIARETVDPTTDRGRPPRCIFNWGKVFSFQAVITSVSVRYTLFMSDGTPVRATMNLTLQECKDAGTQEPQNPTSQGTLGHKVHIVRPGDTIDGIAAREYGDPRAWRFIADNNNLDNPKDLQPGQILVIAPLAQREAAP